MNHSCNPNCKADKWTVAGEIRMGLFATKDIAKNTELTFSYNLDAFYDNVQECYCGSENCRGFIGTKPKVCITYVQPIALLGAVCSSHCQFKLTQIKGHNMQHP
jgi:hypothetical protein